MTTIVAEKLRLYYEEAGSRPWTLDLGSTKKTHHLASVFFSTPGHTYFRSGTKQPKAWVEFTDVYVEILGDCAYISKALTQPVQTLPEKTTAPSIPLYDLDAQNPVFANGPY